MLQSAVVSIKKQVKLGSNQDNKDESDKKEFRLNGTGSNSGNKKKANKNSAGTLRYNNPIYDKRDSEVVPSIMSREPSQDKRKLRMRARPSEKDGVMLGDEDLMSFADNDRKVSEREKSMSSSEQESLSVIDIHLEE